MDGSASDEQAFAREVARLRASAALGEGGRLRELFEYLAARGPNSGPASQAEIADAVFGHPDPAGDDAAARVYVHRLRKRLEDFYAGIDEPSGARLVLPSGTYALRLQATDPAAPPEAGETIHRRLPWRLILLATAAVVLTFAIARALAPDGAPPVNAFWRPIVESERPILIVVGDYYMFGEIDPVRPEQSRLIRDYRIDSPTELAAMQDAEPARYGNAEDVGLSYLPLSTAYALRHIAPVLTRLGREVRVVAASELDAHTAREANIVYLGLLSGMGLLEDTTFAGSSFAIGESYDEIVDARARRVYTSEEARRLASPVFYRDYGYLARFEAPGGTLVAVVAGARETALRSLAPLATATDLPDPIAELAEDDGSFEAVFQVTGQQGADLSERLLVARARR